VAPPGGIGGFAGAVAAAAGAGAAAGGSVTFSGTGDAGKDGAAAKKRKKQSMGNNRRVSFAVAESLESVREFQKDDQSAGAHPDPVHALQQQLLQQQKQAAAAVGLYTLSCSNEPS
jgi:hypothetical protein